MIDEEILTSEIEDDIPEPAPEPEPEPIPEPAPAPEPEPTPGPAPEPEAPANSVEVITVEDLLNRIIAKEDGEAEEPPQDAEEEGGGFLDDLPDAKIEDGPIEVVGMDMVLKRLETIQQTEDHPALTTPFEDYTVTEGLLLLLFLSVFVMACVKLLKGGFAWLR